MNIASVKDASITDTGACFVFGLCTIAFLIAVMVIIKPFKRRPAPQVSLNAGPTKAALTPGSAQPAQQPAAESTGWLPVVANVAAVGLTILIAAAALDYAVNEPDQNGIMLTEEQSAQAQSERENDSFLWAQPPP